MLESITHDCVSEVQLLTSKESIFCIVNLFKPYGELFHLLCACSGSIPFWFQDRFRVLTPRYATVHFLTVFSENSSFFSFWVGGRPLLAWILKVFFQKSCKPVVSLQLLYNTCRISSKTVSTFGAEATVGDDSRKKLYVWNPAIQWLCYLVPFLLHNQWISTYLFYRKKKVNLRCVCVCVCACVCEGPDQSHAREDGERTYPLRLRLHLI